MVSPSLENGFRRPLHATTATAHAARRGFASSLRASAGYFPSDEGVVGKATAFAHEQ
jgi:hypothetical protein